MWIELHMGPLNDPRPVTVNTDHIQDFQPVTSNLESQTHIWFTQEDGYIVVEGYNRVRELVVPGSKKLDNTGERLRKREEFFRNR